jgi:hypothetical protein
MTQHEAERLHEQEDQTCRWQVGARCVNTSIVELASTS